MYYAVNLPRNVSNIQRDCSAILFIRPKPESSEQIMYEQRSADHHFYRSYSVLINRLGVLSQAILLQESTTIHIRRQ